MRKFLWLIYAAGAVAFTVAYFVAGSGTSLQAVLYQSFGTATIIAIAVGLHHHRPGRKAPWLLIAGGLVLWAVGDAYRWILHAQAPFPSIADAAYLGGYPLLIAGVLALGSGSLRPRITDAVDSMIVAVVAAVLCWSFVVEPVLGTPGLSAGATAVSVATPVADLVLLVALIQSFCATRVRNPAVRFLLLGFACLLFSDLAYAYLNLRSGYTSGMWIDAGWIASYALFGIGALHPSMSGIQMVRRAEAAASSHWRIALLALAILVSPVALFIDELTNKPMSPMVIGIGGVVITALVGIRVALLQRERNWIQAALALSEQRYRELFEEADEARTALANQNEQLREVDRLKDELVALVSHELRTPLTSILGYVELTTDEADTLTDEQRGFLTIVTRNAERLLELVNDLLFVAQVQPGRLSLEKKAMDVCHLVDEAVLAARPRAAERTIELTLHADGEAEIAGDHSRLTQVIDNLLSNAIKFTPVGGSVAVSVTAGRDDVVISVSDTGMGIPADEHEQLFTRFFRTEAATAIQGTGLGLSIVKAIVDAHDGQITVESEENEGATFRIVLPRLPVMLALPTAA